MTPAAKTYSLRMLGASLAYTGCVIGINLVDNAFALVAWQRIGLSLLPLIPALIMLWAVVSFVRTLDEVMARIITESVIIGAGIVAFGTFTYGFLQGAVDLPNIHMTLIMPAMIGFSYLAGIFVKRRYS